MGIVAKNIAKKSAPEKKEPIVINDFAKWRANQGKRQEEVVVETPVVEDTKTETKRQPSSKWLSIKESDYVSHLIK
jgi:hypothetical protein